jgi:hypothetical protein
MKVRSALKESFWWIIADCYLPCSHINSINFLSDSTLTKFNHVTAPGQLVNVERIPLHSQMVCAQRSHISTFGSYYRFGRENMEYC